MGSAGYAPYSPSLMATPSRRLAAVLSQVLLLVGVRSAAAAGATSAAPATAAPATAAPATAAPPAAEADWVVVGAGAGACAAAAQLADAGEEVLVLERGHSDLGIKDTLSAYEWPAVVNTDALQPIRWTDGVWGAAPQVLGGGTSVNGGLFFAETPDFFKAAFGDDVDLRGIYESYRYLERTLATPLEASAFGEAWTAALGEAGQNSADPELRVMWKDGTWIAYSTFNVSAKGWPRRGAAALLHARMHLPNLSVRTLATVHRILFEGSRAVGVSVSGRSFCWFCPRGGLPVRARKGVLLGAGAILTPQLLQVSGIGEAALLRRLGVQPVVPGLPVGRNFIDRPVMSFSAYSPKKVPFSVGYTVCANTTAGLLFEYEAGGEVTTQFAIASLALGPPADRSPWLRPLFRRLFYHPVTGRPTAIGSLINEFHPYIALQLSPFSRGQVEAKSRDVRDAPSVTPNYFADPRDLELQRTAVRELLRIAQAPALAEYTADKLQWHGSQEDIPDFLRCLFEGEHSPPRLVTLPCLPGRLDNASLDEFIRKYMVSSYHYFGTAAAGPVVDPARNFAVRGAEGLHVVDASILPSATRVNPQATIMAVGGFIGKRLAQGAPPRRGQEAAPEPPAPGAPGRYV